MNIYDKNCKVCGKEMKEKDYAINHYNTKSEYKYSICNNPKCIRAFWRSYDRNSLK